MSRCIRRRYPMPAHTYYVDQTAGNDANGGREYLPLKTLHQIDAHTTLKPGDRVLYKKGETWAETLTPGNTGTIHRRIQYGAYGSTGANPIIDGSALVAALNIATSTAAYLSFENMKFSGCTGASKQPVTVASHHIGFYGCEVSGSSQGSGMYFLQDASNVDPSNCIIHGCSVHNNATSGIIFNGLGDAGPIDVLIENNTCYSNGTSNSAHHGIYADWDCTVRYNTCYSNAAAGIKTNDETNTDAPLIPKVYNNECYSNYIGIYNGHHGTLIYNNDSHNNTDCGIQFDNASFNIFCLFNSFVNNGSYGIRWPTSSTAIHQINFQNNLLVQDVPFGNGRPIEADSHANTAANNTINYNLYYHTGSTGSLLTTGDQYLTFAQWKALTGSPDANSAVLTTIPGLAFRYTNNRAITGGNLSAAGLAVAGYTKDKDGVTRAATPAVGAYEAVTADGNPSLGSFDFNGTTDRIDWSSVADLNGSALTISAWINPDTFATNSNYVFCAHSSGDAAAGVLMQCSTAGRLTFLKDGATDMVREAASSSNCVSGRWCNVLVTHTGSSSATDVACYYNGVVAASYTTTTNSSGEYPHNGSWSIGGRKPDDLRNFNGNICQVAVWNAVLASTSITGLAAGKAPTTYPTNLIYYWQGNTNSLVADVGGTGTADGTTYEVNVGPVIVYP